MVQSGIKAVFMPRRYERNANCEKAAQDNPHLWDVVVEDGGVCEEGCWDKWGGSELLMDGGNEEKAPYTGPHTR